MAMKSIGLSLLGVAVLAGCAGGGADAPVIVDAQRDATFQADLDQCRQIARTRPNVDGNQQTDAAVLAGVGALIGAAEGGLDGAIAGGAIGGGIGLGGAALESRRERTEIVQRCLAGRGYRVLG